MSLRQSWEWRRDERLGMLCRVVLTVVFAVTAAGFFATEHPSAMAAGSAPRTRGSPTATPADPAANLVLASANLIQEPRVAGVTPPPEETPTAATGDWKLASIESMPSATPSGTGQASEGVAREAALPATRTPAPGPHAPAPSPTATPAPAALDAAGLTRALSALIASADGTYGIDVIDLTTGQEVGINSTAPMTAASVNKLEILATLYHEVERGKLSLSQTVRTKADDIQDYGTGVIRYQPVGTSYTLEELAGLLVEQSDNTASYMLAQLVGLPTVRALVGTWGLQSTDVGDGVSSPHDAAALLALLYRGQLANAAHTAQIVDFLTRTAWNDRIPAGVPPGIPVAHKIGNQVNVLNDVGIVYLPGRPYVLSIFTAGVNEERALALEPSISRAVFEFEQRANGGR